MTTPTNTWHICIYIYIYIFTCTRIHETWMHTFTVACIHVHSSYVCAAQAVSSHYQSTNVVFAVGVNACKSVSRHWITVTHHTWQLAVNTEQSSILSNHKFKIKAGRKNSNHHYITYDVASSIATGIENQAVILTSKLRKREKNRITMIAYALWPSQ